MTAGENRDAWGRSSGPPLGFRPIRSRKALNESLSLSLTRFVVSLLLILLAAGPASARLRRAQTDLAEVLARMNDTAKHLKTVTADLDYTTVTVLVNDRSTETGQFYLRNPKTPDILIQFQ